VNSLTSGVREYRALLDTQTKFTTVRIEDNIIPEYYGIVQKNSTKAAVSA